jgi:hypothetical protein
MLRTPGTPKASISLSFQVEHNALNRTLLTRNSKLHVVNFAAVNEWMPGRSVYCCCVKSKEAGVVGLATCRHCLVVACRDCECFSCAVWVQPCSSLVAVASLRPANSSAGSRAWKSCRLPGSGSVSTVGVQPSDHGCTAV